MSWTARHIHFHREKQKKLIEYINFPDKYGTNTAVLKNHNKLRSTSLRVGQKIKIPGAHNRQILKTAAVKVRTHGKARRVSFCDSSALW